MKITVISLDNWGYNQYILDELSAYSSVEANHINFDKFIYKYPSPFHRIFNFISKTFFNYNIKRNHLDRIILNEVKKLGKQDKILIIKADFLSVRTIKSIKKYAKELIAFYNDNIDRCPRIESVFSYFDTNFSFEPRDSKKHGFNFITNYIYHKHLKVKPDNNQDSIYEVFNISTNGRRNKIIENIAIELENRNIPHKIIIVDRYLNGEPKSNLYQKETLDITMVNDYISKAKTLLDVQRLGQDGLTFRVMDSLALEKKLITTNSDIKNYDFFNPNNILIIDPENIKINSEFFSKPYEAIPQHIYKNYTIDKWVKTVFKLD